MKKFSCLFLSFLIGVLSCISSLAQEKDVELAFEDEEIPVIIRNDFDKEIQVQLDTNRKYTIGPKEKIVIGNRKPGKYTLTIYNKRGEFVDNITQNLSKQNKWILNYDTVSNSGKITDLSAGQRAAITAGAVGAAALGGVLLHMALMSDDSALQETYTPPLLVPPDVQAPLQAPTALLPPSGVANTVQTAVNAFAPSGKAFKFLNAKYDQVTLIVEGTDGNPIGSNWVIDRGASTLQPQPLLFDSKKITINPDQKISVVIPGGYKLQRYAFELPVDPVDGSYVWLVK